MKDKFLKFFPEFKSYRIYRAVVGINLQDGVEKFAFKNGLMVFRYKRYKDKGEVEILNPEGLSQRTSGWFNVHLALDEETVDDIGTG